MALSLSICHLNCTLSSLAQLGSSSRNAPTVCQSYDLNSRPHMCPQFHNFSTTVSSGHSLGNWWKRSSWGAQLEIYSPILSSGNFHSTRSPWVCSISSNAIPGNRSSSSLARELSHFTQSSTHIERRKRTSDPRPKSSEGTEAKTDTESEAALDNKENDEGLAGREVTAAVTVAAIAPDVEAVSRVLETAKEQVEATGEDSAPPAAAAAESFISEELAAIYAKCKQWQWKDHYSINYIVQGSGPPVVLVHGFGASIGHWRKYLSRNRALIGVLELGSRRAFVFSPLGWNMIMLFFVLVHELGQAPQSNCIQNILRKPV